MMELRRLPVKFIFMRYETINILVKGFQNDLPLAYLNEVKDNKN